MASEWPTMSLRQAKVALIDCDHRTPAPSDTGYPYVTIPQLRHGRIELTYARLISPEHYTEWTRKAKPAPHDVVLSRRCNPGETAFVPAKLNSHLAKTSFCFVPTARGLSTVPPLAGQRAGMVGANRQVPERRCGI